MFLSIDFYTSHFFNDIFSDIRLILRVTVNYRYEYTCIFLTYYFDIFTLFAHFSDANQVILIRDFLIIF